MKLKGGVIIIGSLIWEDHLKEKDKDNIRRDWRNKYLLDNDNRYFTKVPIRYGRESQTRNYTYTMIFSKSYEAKLGQGIILPFNEEIISFESIEIQAKALAVAEGIYKKSNRRLTTSWGSVAILINPEVENEDPDSFALIKNKWSDIYSNYRNTFNYKNYKTESENESVITPDGFLNINWQYQSGMKDFDILIATPVIPEPKRILTSSEIADRINEKKDSNYFKKNRENKIESFDDIEIERNINN
ncbi:MAG: hypothetical protein U9N72_00005 [Bacteroidota bacterium]|nr:hypothetical protein [Bacteroidota bacterium]